MAVENLLGCLDKVREKPTKGTSRNWEACCPAHDDNDPSLSITELSDQRVLVHCWAGCSALDVISSLGLEWSELFPPDDNYQPLAKTKHSTDLDKMLVGINQRTVDEIVIAMGDESMAKGEKLSPQDRQRYMDAWIAVNGGAA